jgi:hypothetical protein
MTNNSINHLEKRIKTVRIKMQDLWNERGYTDEAVLTTSIELDKLLNKYQRLRNQTSIYQK